MLFMRLSFHWIICVYANLRIIPTLLQGPPCLYVATAGSWNRFHVYLPLWYDKEFSVTLRLTLLSASIDPMGEMHPIARSIRMFGKQSRSAFFNMSMKLSCNSLLSFDSFSVSVLQNLTQRFISLRKTLVVFVDKSSPKAFWSDAAVALRSNFDKRQTEGNKVNSSVWFSICHTIMQIND